MVDSKHLKGCQGRVDAFNNHFSSIIDKISKTNIDSKINDEIFFYFWLLFRTKLLPSLGLWFLKLSQPKKLNQ